MRVDIRRLLVKGQNKKLVDRVTDYVALMDAQGKPLQRAIVTPQQYDALIRLAGKQDRHPVLCCGDVLVHYHHEPIDEREPVPEPVHRYVAELPPVTANPFGVVPAAKPAPVSVPAGTDCTRCGGEGCELCDTIPF